MTQDLKGRPVTVVYEIEDEVEWRKINPLTYRHHGIKAVEVAAADGCEALRSLEELLPFVLDYYYPNCATPEFKQAVEKAKQVIEGSKHGARPTQPDQQH